MTRLTTNLTKLLAASAIALAAPACVQQKEKPTPVAVAQVAAETKEAGGPALWKVADEDTTIYLFGTVHVLPEDIDWYSGNIADALNASEKLITEIHIEKGSEAQMQQAFMSKGTLPAGTTLRSLLSDEQRTTYDAAMTKLGLPVSAFDQFEPWFAAVNLSMIPLLKAGYGAESGVEKVLEQKAEGKGRGNLETIDFQISVFDELPQETQIKFMMETAEMIDEIVPGLDAMVGEWVEGDPDGLAKLLNENLSDPMLAERLLYARNANWAEWIDTRLDTPGTVFIAVGAGHLAGKKSVQDYLDGRGIPAARIQ